MENVAPHLKKATTENMAQKPITSTTDLTKLYDVVLSGQVANGHDPSAVVQSLARVLRIKLNDARKLVAGRSVTIKSRAPTPVALRYLHTLNRVGATATLVPALSSQKTVTKNKRGEESNFEAAKPEQALPTALTSNRIYQQLQFHLIPAHISTNDTIKLLATATGVFVLPALYLALVGAVSFSVFWHMLASLSWFTGDGSIVFIFPYLSLLVFGAFIALLLIKPLIAPTASTYRNLRFSPDREPLLFAFVDAIARSVHAPTPNVIGYTWQSTLFAESRSGILAAFRRDVRLVIGLPLAGSLSLTQLGGLVAMELARFSRRPHYRLVFMIDAVRHLFYHCAYEDDLWDQSLESAIRSSNGIKALALVSLQAIQKLSRLPMVFLNFLCEGLSSATLYQFRLNSDRYAAALAGAKETRQALTRLQALIAAQPLVVDDLVHHWQNGERVNRIPDAIVERSNRLPAHVLSNIRETAGTRSLGSMGIYPSLTRRFNALSVLPQQALTSFTEDAVQLIPSYRSLSSVATQEYYDSVAVLFDARPAPTLPIEMGARREEREATILKNFFCGAFHADRFLIPDYRDQASLFHHVNLSRELEQIVEELRLNTTSYSRDLAIYDAIRRGTPRNRTVHSAASASGAFRTAPYQHAINPNNTHSGRTSEEELEQRLWRHEALLEKRLGIGLTLLSKRTDPRTKVRIETLVRAQKQLSRAKPYIESMLHFSNTLHHGLHPRTSLAALDGTALRRQMSQCRDSYIALLAYLAEGQFPFQGGDNPNHIVSYFQHSAGHPNAMLKDPELCIANVHAVLQNIQALHRSLMAQMVELALSGESELAPKPVVTTQRPNIDPHLLNVF